MFRKRLSTLYADQQSNRLRFGTHSHKNDSILRVSMATGRACFLHFKPHTMLTHFLPFLLFDVQDCVGRPWQTSWFWQSMHLIWHQCCEYRWDLQTLNNTIIQKQSVYRRRRRSAPQRRHLHDRVLQKAGSCGCSVPVVLISQGEQVPWVMFQMQWIPGQAWTQDDRLEKAEQLGDVYMRTSLSRRLLKPPNTYIALHDKRGNNVLEDYRGRDAKKKNGLLWIAREA